MLNSASDSDLIYLLYFENLLEHSSLGGMKGRSPQSIKINYQLLTIQFEFLISWTLNSHYKFGLESFTCLLQCKAVCILPVRRKTLTLLQGDERGVWVGGSAIGLRCQEQGREKACYRRFALSVLSGHLILD